MKQERLIALLFSLLIISVGIIFFINPKKTYSSDENRYLKTSLTFNVRSLFNGNYIKDLEIYLTDQFPYRQFFINVKTKYEKATLKDESNGVYFGKKNYLIEKYNGLPEQTKIINTLNNFQTKLNYLNTNLILVPTSITINADKLPSKSIRTNQLKDITDIYNNVTLNTIDVYNTLADHNQVMPMFYSLDHHWTTYGAYYAYVEYCKHNNIAYLEIDDFEVKEVTNDFKGTLYSKSGDYNHSADKIYAFFNNNEYEANYVYDKIINNTLYEEKCLKEKDKHAYFLNNNHPLIIVTNKTINNNKEIIVIKDSYANSFIPFLANHYKKVHVIDLRYYSESASEYILKNRNIKDALILYNMGTIGTDAGIITLR